MCKKTDGGFLAGSLAAVVIALIGLSCGTLGAEPAKPLSLDKSVVLEKMRGVVVQRNDAKQVERVVVRGRKVDAQIMAALKDLGSLRDLELHEAELSADAWRDISVLHQLRRLGLFDTPVDFAALHRVLAANPRLTVDPCPVAFSTRAGGLVVDLPRARLFLPEIQSSPGYREQLALASTASSGMVARIPLLPVRRGKVKATLDEMMRLANRPINNGIVWSTGPQRSFHINSEGTVLTIGDREFPLAAPRRTIVVEQDHRITLPDWNLRYDQGVILFVRDPDEMSPGNKLAPGNKSNSDDKPGRSSRPNAVADKARQDEIDSYLRSHRRVIMSLVSVYRYGWVLALTPYGGLEGDDLRRGAFKADVTHGMPPLFYDIYEDRDYWREQGRDVEGRGAYKASIGITLAFRWEKLPTSESGPLRGKSRSQAEEIASEERGRRFYEDFVPSAGTMGFVWSGHGYNMVAECNRGKWAIRTFNDFDRLGKFEDLRAMVHADQGDLVLTFGGSSSKEGDVRVDGKGTNVRVGDRSIVIRPQERPTIVIGGSRSDKPKKGNNEPLRVLRVEGNGPSPGDGGRKG